MNNKDMPDLIKDLEDKAIASLSLLVCAYQDMNHQRSTIDAIQVLRGRQTARQMAVARKSYADCMLECGGLTNWCKCRSDQAALAELEKRND